MSEQYFEAHPVSAHQLREIKLSFLGTDFVFETDAGVFSRDGLDDGTELLLKEALPHLSGRVLDLGCGWGAVGVISKKIKPAADLVMTDINTRAAELAKRNLRRNGVQAEVVSGDGFEAVEGIFDWILLNPPIRAGKQLVYSLYQDSAQRLRDSGTLAIVIRKQQGALSTKDYLQTLFEEVRLINRKKGYHIYFCGRTKHEV
ncbi:MAG: class I SAM-dependent methyltransferase [Clostridiales bacterium]|nr:class I SAM-dependent methyltransferase [Clostridiales bacterium]